MWVSSSPYLSYFCSIFVSFRLFSIFSSRLLACMLVLLVILSPYYRASGLWRRRCPSYWAVVYSCCVGFGSTVTAASTLLSLALVFVQVCAPNGAPEGYGVLSSQAVSYRQRLGCLVQRVKLFHAGRRAYRPYFQEGRERGASSKLTGSYALRRGWMDRRSVFAGFSFCLPLAFSSGYWHLKGVDKCRTFFFIDEDDLAMDSLVKFKGIISKRWLSGVISSISEQKQVQSLCSATYLMLQLSNAEPCSPYAYAHPPRSSSRVEVYFQMR